jgi:chromosomal replication initiation ATPase DnaA
MNKNTNDVFERVMARLKAQVGQEVFTSWFGRLKLQSASKSVVRLSVPTAFPQIMDQQQVSRPDQRAVPRRGA